MAQLITEYVLKVLDGEFVTNHRIMARVLWYLGSEFVLTRERRTDDLDQYHCRVRTRFPVEIDIFMKRYTKLFKTSLVSCKVRRLNAPAAFEYDAPSSLATSAYTIAGPWYDTDFLDAAVNTFRTYTLHPWQREVLGYLKEPGDRGIYWIVDCVGKTGVKTFCQYLQQTEGCDFVTPAFAFQLQDAVARSSNRLWLLVRPSANLTDDGAFYDVLEGLKHQYTWNGAGTKRVKLYEVPTIVVFASKFPLLRMVATDRWKLRVMQPEKTLETVTVREAGTCMYTPV